MVREAGGAGGTGTPGRGRGPSGRPGPAGRPEARTRHLGYLRDSLCTEVTAGANENLPRRSVSTRRDADRFEALQTRNRGEIRLRSAAGAVHGERVLIRREAARDTGVIRAITAAAFARPGQPPDEIVPEARLVDELRASPAWLPALSLVAATPADEVIGHVLCTRGHVGQAPVLALGPLTVRPDSQRRGVGSALMHAVLGAADATGEPLVALLGDPAYYGRFGFRPSTGYQITPPRPHWQPHFQVRVLTGYQPQLSGMFTYPEPFDRT